MKWKVNIFDGPYENIWEIAVVKEDNEHGLNSYGWFGDDKILISTSGGRMPASICQFVWDELVILANKTADRLNKGLHID